MKGAFVMEKLYKQVGFWYQSSNVEMVEIKEYGGTKIYALNGWNGEFFTDCWECVPDGSSGYDAGEKCCICPIYDDEQNENDGYDIIDYRRCF